MAKGELKPAETNPWYVLMTLHGEQTGDVNDRALAERNRRAWNAWSCQRLTDEQRAELAKKMGLEVAELSAWPEREAEIRALFQQRLGKGSELPDVAEYADLREITFSNTVVLKKVIFTQDARFLGATFMQHASFSDVTFMQHASFVSATFTQAAWFNHVTFTEQVWFGGATFTQDAWFNDATFTQDAWFGGATFTQAARFAGATFTQDASFVSATFTQAAWFNGATFTQDAWFDGASFLGRANFVRARFAGARQKGGDLVDSRANFRDAEFQRPVTFREAVFADAYPDWTGAILPKNVEFTAENTAVLPVRLKNGGFSRTDTETVRLWPDDAKVDPRSSRESCATMRHALNQQGLPEAEHFFYRKEMAFATRIGGWWERLPYRLFGLFSGYGYSIVRPLVWLGLLFIFAWLLNLCPFVWEATLHGGPRTGAEAFGLSFANTFGFLGLHRVYFESGYFAALPVFSKVIGVLQSFLGIILLFFLGLGLRTRFRLR